MDDALKALLLLNCVGVSNAARWKKFAANHESRSVWKESYQEIKVLGVSEAAHGKIRSRFNAAWAESEYNACIKKGVKIITCMDKEYPGVLYDLEDPPLLLYWHGAADRLPAESISVVGTRRASAYGRKTAWDLGAKCAEMKIGLVSGGASGVDGSAHAGVCGGNGTTFAVLGTGIDKVYPSSNEKLFENIRECGALITEYPLGTNGEPWRFPRRNRIVAAISGKTVVIEAPEKSGAMITARMALELGREVWAVPGRIDEVSASGSNRLIFDGACPLICLETFFGSIGGQTLLFESSRLEEQRKIMENLSGSERRIMDALRLNGERTVDNLSIEVKMSAAEVMKIIAVLSAKDLAYSAGPGRFSAKF